MPVLKYLIIMLSDDSVSFCNYESGNRKSAALISFGLLTKAVTYALKNNLKVNFLYPGIRPGKKYERLIEDVEHVKIVPYKLAGIYEDAVAVIDPADLKKTPASVKIKNANVILRISREEIKKLNTYALRLLKNCQRVNVVIKDIEGLSENDLREYGRQLEKISSSILRSAGKGILPEINALTDRIILEQMNNCDAGLTHLTVAPDGMLYTCPAFYYESMTDNHGEIRNDIKIANRRLLEIKYSPICRICDAYQCRRCVYLNRKLTGELNTPSWQQCRVSHAEREASRQMLNRLKESGFRGAETKEIKALNYDDPFETAVKNRYSIEEFKNLK